MKKLVKTAKQQFEERLNHFNLTQEWSNQSCVGRIGKDLDGEGIVIFIHESEDDGYSEYHYPSFSELRDDSNFVQNCLREFSCCDDNFILSMVKWFTYDSKENPFDAVDVYFPADTFKLNSSVNFGDIYEEVPDVRVITAKEQWENDSKDAELCCNLDNGTIWKVQNLKDCILFFRKNDSDGFYHRYALPPFEELRKDASFVTEYISFVNDMHPEDLEYALKWIKGGEYGMSACSMMDIYQSTKTMGTYEYEDKEVEPIEKKDFSSEITDLKERMIKHLSDLCNQGMKVDFDWMCVNMHTVGWGDGSFDYIDSIEHFDVFMKDVPYVKFVTEHSKDIFETRLINLTIESIWSIINAMR